MDYLMHILILIGFYSILSQGLCLLTGYGGMVSLAQAAFYGVGAYVAALLAITFQVPFLVAVLASMLISALIAWIVSLASLRTVEDYFIICTLGIQLIITALMNNWVGLTKGPLGIAGIPPIHFLGMELSGKLPFLILTWLCVLSVYLILQWLAGTSFGRVLRALSEDEIFAEATGHNVVLTKRIAFILSSVIACVPGCLYAHYISFIDPSGFTMDTSIFILSIVIIGGIRNLQGCIAASALLVLIPELLRFLGLPSFDSAVLQRIIYGGLMVAACFLPKKKDSK